MAGWLHGVFVVDWLFVFPLCGFSLSLFCNYMGLQGSYLHEFAPGNATSMPSTREPRQMAIIGCQRNRL